MGRNRPPSLACSALDRGSRPADRGQGLVGRLTHGSVKEPIASLQCIALLSLLTLGAACAQTITVLGNPPSYFAATLGIVRCSYWVAGEPPGSGSEIAVYNSGVLDPASIKHFPAPANGTAIFPCPAPLDRFQIAVSATGAITASIVPLPPPPPQAYTDVVVTMLSDGIKNTIPLPSAPKSPPSVQVSVGGLIQTPGSKWTLSGTTVALTFTPVAGLEMVVLYR